MSATAKPLHVVTVATRWRPGLGRMLHSADACGLTVAVRGMGDPRAGQGFMKLEALRATADALVAQQRVDDVVLLVDAFDVIFVPGTSSLRLLKGFEETGCDILLAGERLCHPDASRVHEYQKHMGPVSGWNMSLPLPFVNSGVIFGRAWALAQTLHGGPPFEQVSDQRWWTTVVLEHARRAASGNGARLAIETRGRLIHCLAEVDPAEISLQPDRTVMISDQKPAILHFNLNDSGSESWQESVFTHLFPATGDLIPASSSFAADEPKSAVHPTLHPEPWPDWPPDVEDANELINSVLTSRRWAVSGHWTGTKPKEQEFAEKFAAWNGVPFCVPVDHGSSALVAALEALDIGPGDEVIVPALTWVATATAVLNAGAIPVFADVDRGTCCISLDAIDKATTSRTKAVIPVHLHCTMADMGGIMSFAGARGLWVIEDCAQSHGAVWRGRRAGSIGHLGCFSMQQSKVLSAGEGGAVITRNKELYERLQQIRADSRVYSATEPGHGQMHLIERGEVMGANYCLSEFQAAILLAQLPYLDEQNIIRETNAEYLDSQLRALGGLTPIAQPPGLERRSVYEYAVRYGPLAFGNRPAGEVCRALSNNLGFAVYQTDLPLPQNPLYCPWTKRRFASLRHPHVLRTVRDLNFVEATSAHHELIVFHHSILLGNVVQMKRIVQGFLQVQKEFQGRSSV